MKTIEPSDPNIAMPPAKDFTEVSDMYLVNQELVQKNQEERATRSELLAEDDALVVKIEFSVTEALALGYSVACVLFLPMIFFSLLSVGGGDGGSIVSSVSFIFLVGIMVILALRAIVPAIKSFCVKSDISEGLVNAMFTLVSILMFTVVYICFGPQNLLANSIAIVVAGPILYTALYYIYTFVHRKPKISQ